MNQREELRQRIRDSLPEYVVRTCREEVAGKVMDVLDSWIEEQQPQEEEIKVGDKVHLNKDITTESNSRTEELCGVEEYMQGFGGDYVGEVLSIEPSDVNPKYEVCLIKLINGDEWYYAAEDLENST